MNTCMNICSCVQKRMLRLFHGWRVRRGRAPRGTPGARRMRPAIDVALGISSTRYWSTVNPLIQQCRYMIAGGGPRDPFTADVEPSARRPRAHTVRKGTPLICASCGECTLYARDPSTGCRDRPTTESAQKCADTRPSSSTVPRTRAPRPGTLPAPSSSCRVRSVAA